jgi:hypothetical protein
MPPELGSQTPNPALHLTAAQSGGRTASGRR